MFRPQAVPVVYGCLLASLFSLTPAEARNEDLLGRLAEVERSFGRAFQHADPVPALRSRFVEMEKSLSSIAALPSRPGAQVEALNHFVFTRLGLRASQDLKDPDNLLPSRVLERKQGYCVGIAAIYLALAEGMNSPIFAVATPSHVFLRFDDGTARINIETLQGGANVPDEQYIREQKIPEKSIRRGIFMRNLTTDEFLGQVHNNLGVIYSERKDYEKAATEYRAALDLDPRLPAAFYNWGNDLLRQGEHRKAIRRFSKSLRLYPTDVWALNNRGLAYMRMGKRQKARRDLKAAMQIDPAFEPARKNLEHGNSPAQAIPEMF